MCIMWCLEERLTVSTCIFYRMETWETSPRVPTYYHYTMWLQEGLHFMLRC